VAPKIPSYRVVVIALVGYIAIIATFCALSLSIIRRLQNQTLLHAREAADAAFEASETAQRVERDLAWR